MRILRGFLGMLGRLAKSKELPILQGEPSIPKPQAHEPEATLDLKP